MPHLRFRGMKLEEVKEISKTLLDDLEKLIEVPKDKFTIELIESKFIVDGEEKNKYPFVNVDWFYKGHDLMKETAVIITNYVKGYGYENVSVYFTNMIKENYFKNGEHFQRLPF